MQISAQLLAREPYVMGLDSCLATFAGSNWPYARNE